jgi:diguanylate cyclase (GGDEF)-like protein/PAS domain S-box-containing protein
MLTQFKQLVTGFLFEKGPIVVFVWKNTPQWPVEAVSANLERLFGHTPPDYVSGKRSYAEQLHPDDLPRVVEEVSRASAEGQDSFVHLPYRYRDSTGTYRWVRDTTMILRDAQGSVTHYVGYLSDITHEYELEEENRVIKERFELAWEGANDGLWDWDLVNGRVFYSGRWKNMLGYGDAEVGDTPDEFFGRIHPEDLERVHAALERHHRNPEAHPFALELRMRCKDGGYRWVMSRGKTLLDEFGTPVRMAGSHSDISRRVEAQEELRRSEHELKQAQQLAKLGSWSLDLSENRLYWSDEIFNIFEIDPQQFEPSYEGFLGAIHPEDVEAVNAAFTASVADRTPYRIQHRLLMPDGRIKHVVEQGETLYDAGGTPVLSRGTVQDVTESANYRSEICHLKEELESIVSHIPSVVFRGEPDSPRTMHYLNNAIFDITGYPASDFIGNRVRSFAEIIHPDDIQTVTEAIQVAVAKQEPYELEYRIVDTGGNILWVNETGRNVPVGNGREALEGVINNITLEKGMTEKLRKFIDIQSSIVILTDGTTLKFANKMFYDFFGFENREAFLGQYRCIGERFVERDDFFHLGQIRDAQTHWVENLLQLPGRERVVLMPDKGAVPHAFTVSINLYDHHTYVVSFTDISDTMTEKLHLKNQVVRDKLTDAFNRVYLDTAATSLIRSHGEQQKHTGIIYFDVDHFKRINDTYGHGVGDLVLKDLVGVVNRNTRNDDALIRMGGEEFMIIAPTPSLQTLQKTAENLRTAIEAHPFNTVGSLTCSFGVTIKGDGEALTAAIDCADAKLYEAKRKGRNRVIG